jgi:hypothetical protein
MTLYLWETLMDHMKFEVLMAVKLSVLVVLVVTLCRGSTFVQIIGICLQVHMALQSRRLTLTLMDYVTPD